jgi:hypothetical protein
MVSGMILSVMTPQHELEARLNLIARDGLLVNRTCLVVCNSHQNKTKENWSLTPAQTDWNLLLPPARRAPMQALGGALQHGCWRWAAT